MRFNIIGASAETGDDIDVMIDAADQATVERIAHDRGILVANIRTASENEDRGVALVVDDPPAPAPSPTNGHHAPANAPAHAPHHGHSHAPDPSHAPTLAPVESSGHGKIITNAGSPSDSVHIGEGHIAEGVKAESAMEYHILLNQSLYLLETAVNKYLKDGWEPQGGICVGTSNNALSYFQAISRRKRPPGAQAVEPNRAATDAG